MLYCLVFSIKYDEDPIKEKDWITNLKNKNPFPIKNSKIEIILFDTKKDTKKKPIINTIDFYLNTLKDKDSLIIIFEGHGTIKPSPEGLTYAEGYYNEGILCSDKKVIMDSDLTNSFLNNFEKTNLVMVINSSCYGDGLFLNYHFNHNHFNIENNKNSYNQFTKQTLINKYKRGGVLITDKYIQSGFVADDVRNINLCLVGLANSDEKTTVNIDFSVINEILKTQSNSFMNMYIEILEQIEYFYVSVYNYEKPITLHFKTISNAINTLKKTLK